MRQVELTKGYVALVDDEDFEHVSQHKWMVIESLRRDGSVRAVYARRYMPRSRTQTQLLHRFVLGIVASDVTVDHKDHDGLNCRKANLRVATTSQNVANSRRYSNNTSGFKGASLVRSSGKWHAQIVVKGKRIHLGYFEEPEDAARAYDLAAMENFGAFAELNFPEEEITA